MPYQDDRPELGPMLREARTSREWTVEHVSVALGFFTARDGKTKVLNRTQVNRIEAGERALSAEEAWRFVEIYPELDALELLRAANAIDEDASPEFRSMIEAEAARRRETYRQGGNRRRSERSMKVVTHASDIVAAVRASSDVQEPFMGTYIALAASVPDLHLARLGQRAKVAA